MKRFLLLVILALTACAPQPTPAGPSAEEVKAMIATSVASTVTALEIHTASTFAQTAKVEVFFFSSLFKNPTRR